MKSLCIKLIFGIAFAFTLIARGEDFGSAAAFKDGDTVCFVGDSITHAGSYPAIIELYYSTRFPDRHIRYYNCGISGDTASAIMSDKRFRQDVDILSHKPTVATIMLGMNDVGRDSYGEGKSGPEIDAKRKGALDNYRKSMTGLAEVLRQSGARLILIEPSIYDETAKQAKPLWENNVGANGALGECASMVRQWAGQFQAGLVNFYGVMNEINHREQQQDPTFSLVRSDRVHPGAVGHFVMAYVFLKAQGLPKYVARIAVDASKGKSGELVNCAVENLTKANGGMEFDCKEGALPLVYPAEREALRLVPFQQELNQELLVAQGLPEGLYQLKIDGKSVGDYSASALGIGVNLAENPLTPQYLQSKIATELAGKRGNIGGILRKIAIRKYSFSKDCKDALGSAALDAALEKNLTESVARANKIIAEGGKANYGFAEEALKLLPEESRLRKEYDDLSVEIVKTCQPQKHHFAIVLK